MEQPAIDTSAVLAAGRRPPEPAHTADPRAARKAAEDFEAFFLTQVIEEMFAGVEPDAMFGGGPGEGVFRSLLFQEYGKAIAHSGGVGIADAVQKEILKLQEARP
ncbi:MAG: rod-binding protein [Rhodospirillaceae bacterium]|nr:rod-binding protein [Rhodospirillaceae bacterium]